MIGCHASPWSTPWRGPCQLVDGSLDSLVSTTPLDPAELAAVESDDDLLALMGCPLPALLRSEVPPLEACPGISRERPARALPAVRQLPRLPLPAARPSKFTSPRPTPGRPAGDGAPGLPRSA
jgi:hypothetical protein